MDEIFEALRAFDFESSQPRLWIFRPSKSAHLFKAAHVPTDDALNDTLRGFAVEQLKKVNEWSPYGHLAHPTETGCLTIPAEETNFIRLMELVSRPEERSKVESTDDLRGAKGYLVKFVLGERVVYATRRSTTAWRATPGKSHLLRVVFRNAKLTAEEDDAFSLDPLFDMFSLDNHLFITSKRGFESMMSHRVAYEAGFEQMRVDPNFAELFMDMAPIVAAVGTNATHLRRLAAISEKGIYKNPGFLQALQDVNRIRNWGLSFDPDTQQLVVMPDQLRLILTILLDQRLMSEVTHYIYDVPHADRVA